MPEFETPKISSTGEVPTSDAISGGGKENLGFIDKVATKIKNILPHIQSNTSRRTFLKGAAAGVVIGAVGATTIGVPDGLTSIPPEASPEGSEPTDPPRILRPEAIKGAEIMPDTYTMNNYQRIRNGGNGFSYKQNHDPNTSTVQVLKTGEGSTFVILKLDVAMLLNHPYDLKIGLGEPDFGNENTPLAFNLTPEKIAALLTEENGGNHSNEEDEKLTLIFTNAPPTDEYMGLENVVVLPPTEMNPSIISGGFIEPKGTQLLFRDEEGGYQMTTFAGGSGPEYEFDFQKNGTQQK